MSDKHNDAVLALGILADTEVSFTRNQIETAYRLLKQRTDAAQKTAVQTWRVGDRVAFDAKGRVQIGVVTKVNTKSVSVGTRDATWRVAGTFLRVPTAADLAPLVVAGKPEVVEDDVHGGIAVPLYLHDRDS